MGLVLKGGVHFSEGGYERIARKVFNTLDVDVFYVRDFDENLFRWLSVFDSLNMIPNVQVISSRLGICLSINLSFLVL